MSDQQALAEPKVGDQIYVRTARHLSHGEDDVVGGLATVSAVVREVSRGALVVFVAVHEHPGHSYNWTILAQEQASLASEFGQACAHADPDLRPEFNQWS